MGFYERNRFHLIEKTAIKKESKVFTPAAGIFSCFYFFIEPVPFHRYNKNRMYNEVVILWQKEKLNVCNRWEAAPAMS